MAIIQVRDFPEPEKQLLARKAERLGISLNAVARNALLREASFEHNAAHLAEVPVLRSGSRFTLDDVLATIDAGRARA
jgi:hypothetical protein